MEDALLVHVCECKVCLAAAIARLGPLVERGCDVYRQLLDRVKVTAAISKSIAHSQGHLSEEVIEEYCFNRLPANEKSTVEMHLSACAPCRRALRDHREFVSYIKSALRNWKGVETGPAIAAAGGRRTPTAAIQPRFSAEDIAEARKRLPVSKVAGIEALKALQRETADLRDIEQIVKTDPVLSAHLVRIANSALLSYGNGVRSVGEAVARLGFERTKLHVWGLSMKRMFLSPNLQKIWDHSILAAQISRQLAEMTGVIAADEASFAALVHDIGQILLTSLGTSFDRAFNQRRGSGMYSVQIERELCGATHAGIGADLLASWHFPADLVDAIRFHHEPAGSSSPLAAILYVAEAWLDNQEDVCDLEEHRSALRRLGLNRLDLSKLGTMCSPDLELLRFAA